AERPAELRAAAPGMTVFDAVDARVPAIVVPLPRVKRIQNGDRFTVLADPGSLARAIIVVLDRDALRTQLIEPLLAKYFGDPRSSEYLVSIVRRDDPAQIVFSSSSGAGIVDARSADVTTGLFDLRLDELNRLASPGPGRGGAIVHERMTFAIVR